MRAQRPRIWSDLSTLMAIPSVADGWGRVSLAHYEHAADRVAGLLREAGLGDPTQHVTTDGSIAVLASHEGPPGTPPSCSTVTTTSSPPGTFMLGRPRGGS